MRCGFQVFEAERGRKTDRRMESDSGPLKRIMPIPPSPTGVAIAAIVSSYSIPVAGRQQLVEGFRMDLRPRQHEYVELHTWLDLGHPFRHNHQPIGMYHGRKHTTALLAGQTSDELRYALLDTHAKILSTISTITEAAFKRSRNHRSEERNTSLHLQERRTTEELKPYHGRHRIPGKAQQWHARDVAKGNRLTGLHFHAP